MMMTRKELEINCELIENWKRGKERDGKKRKLYDVNTTQRDDKTDRKMQTKVTHGGWGWGREGVAFIHQNRHQQPLAQ